MTDEAEHTHLVEWALLQAGKAVYEYNQQVEETFGEEEYDAVNQPGEYVVVIRAADTRRFLDMIECRPDCFAHKFDYDGGHTRKKWLDVEKRYLTEHYGKMTAKQIADELNRSKSSIYHQANRMGLEA